MDKVKVTLLHPCAVSGSGVIYRLPAGEVEVYPFLLDLIRAQYPGALATPDTQTKPESEAALPDEAPENTDLADLQSVIVRALKEDKLEAFYASSGRPKPSYFSKQLGRPVPRSLLETAFDEVMRERNDADE